VERRSRNRGQRPAAMTRWANKKSAIRRENIVKKGGRAEGLSLLWDGCGERPNSQETGRRERLGSGGEKGSSGTRKILERMGEGT